MLDLLSLGLFPPTVAYYVVFGSLVLFLAAAFWADMAAMYCPVYVNKIYPVCYLNYQISPRVIYISHCALFLRYIFSATIVISE
jgi:hypothetical protein